ncbi:hypothetical protein HN807_11990 [Candidatus Bathyarchaeota archaeon]|jgi:hypothetical protein|nr:hypothetical protein [Candidatus Bathyarchaeota archaeon]MBT4319801.1 hypothetical protein [Candidatus Bathyarchaeota archaeon]MBT4425174.1 hypothetical protein [Candidatus Bathyarchaeota archaeon]MBT5642640.1 hypothetical protein [Candidatus Bathyarchaeota archaeon]MBT6605059.1 hypothetical protein [Candidatus Bathyarchaeota archaeon]
MISTEETLRRVGRAIATTRFPFIDQEDWDITWGVYTNDYLEEQLIIEVGEERYTPSIVSTFENGDLRVICEVESNETVSVDQIPRWRALSDLAGVTYKLKKFFLYVPEGKESETQKLLQDNGIEYAGLRTWAIRDGSLVIKPITTPDESKDHRVT